MQGGETRLILASLLFNIYSYSLFNILQRVDIQASKLTDRYLTILFHTDDEILFSLSSLGMTQILRTLAYYCNEEQLVINCDESKILEVFFIKSKSAHEQLVPMN